MSQTNIPDTGVSNLKPVLELKKNKTTIPSIQWQCQNGSKEKWTNIN